ncbi:MAG: CoA-binding protein [Rhodospirillales bacterium]|nr:CoA-binding protein [Rhodospirillales bacterium]
MSRLVYPDSLVLNVLKTCRTIAMVGASTSWNRPSYFAMKYLQAKGYRVIPVNPQSAKAGESILGEKAYASVTEIPGSIDLVDIFRRSDAVGPIVDEAIQLAPEKHIRVIWMQLGVINEDAALRAEKAGLTVIMDRCIKIEFGRFSGELSWGGIDSGVITSRRRRLIA